MTIAQVLARHLDLSVALTPEQKSVLLTRLEQRSHKTDSCWCWLGGAVGEDGYGCILGMRVHRVSFAIHCGPIPSGMMVCHHCDVPACWRPEHLFCGTAADNNRDMLLKGRLVPPPKLEGTNNPLAKLSIETVQAIRARYSAGGTSFRKLAQEYGLNVITIFNAITGDTWKVAGQVLHVPLIADPSRLCACGCGLQVKGESPKKRWATRLCRHRVRYRKLKGRSAAEWAKMRGE